MQQRQDPGVQLSPLNGTARGLNQLRTSASAPSSMHSRANNFNVNVARRMKSRHEPDLFPAKAGNELRSTSGQVVPIWMTTGEHERRHKVIAHEFNRKKKFMSGTLLNDVMEYMVDEQKITREVAAQGKWEELIHLNKTLKKEEYQHIKLGGTPECLYEKFYKAEPRPHCTQARFLIILRQVYGFELANTDRICDSKMLKHLENLYYFFDVCDSVTGEAVDRMDWKALIFALRLLQYPFDKPLAQMDWGFALYSSEGFLDATHQGQVNREDVINMFSVAGATGSSIQYLKHCTEQALNKLEKVAIEEARSCDVGAMMKPGTTADDILAAAAAAEVEKDMQRRGKGKSRKERAAEEANSSKHLKLDKDGRLVLNHKAFRQLLATAPVKHFLEPSSRMKFLTQWEEWYHPVLIEFLVKERKERFDAEKGAMYRKVLEQRCLNETLTKWASFVSKRMRARSLVIEFIRNFRAQNQRLGFDKLLEHAMQIVGLVHMQRYVRGFLGRCFVEDYTLARWAARLTQAHYRGHMARVRLRREYERRRLAATRIQSYFRGRLARVRAKSVLQEHYMKVHGEIQMSRSIWMNRLQIRCSKLIQRAWRKFKGITIAKERKGQVEREKAVKKQMEEAEVQEARRMEIYMSNMEKAYADAKATELQRRVDAEKTFNEKLKIMGYRRLKAIDEHIAEKERQRLEDEEKERQRLAKWTEDWHATMETRAAQERARVDRVLERPEKGTGERHEQSDLKRRIKQRSKVVMRREEQGGNRIEYVESEMIAAEEIKQEMMQAEREKVKKEWDKAEVEWQKELAEERAQKRMEEEAQEHLDECNAAEKFIRAYRSFKARQNLRAEIRKVYNKRYDPSTMTGFYTNTLQGEVKWTKPLLLGDRFDSDLDYVDEWVLCVDKEFGKRKFLYNAYQLNMRWDEPRQPAFGAKQAFTEEAEAWVRGLGLIRQKLELFVLRHGGGDNEKELLTKWFYEVDLDRSGFLDLDEVHALLLKAGMKLRDEQLELIILELDRDQDGKVGLKDLVSWLDQTMDEVCARDMEWLLALSEEHRTREFLLQENSDDRMLRMQEERKKKEEDKAVADAEEEKEWDNWIEKKREFTNMKTKEIETYTYWKHRLTGEERTENPKVKRSQLQMINENDELSVDEQLKMAFAQFDTDNSKYLDLQEVEHLIAFCRGKPIVGEELDQIFQEMDSSNDGWVSRDEFTLWWRQRSYEERMVKEGKGYLLDKPPIVHEEGFWRAVKEKDEEGVPTGVVYYEHSVTGETATEDPRLEREMKAVISEFGVGMTVDEQCRLAFQQFDEDQSGYLQVDEVQKLLGSLGRAMHGPDLQNAMYELDTSGDGWVSLEEFTVWYKQNVASQTGLQNVPAATDAPDANNSGSADWQQLQDESGNTYYYNNATGETSWEDPNMRSSMQAHLSQYGADQSVEAQIEAAFKQFDRDGTGYMDAQELGYLVSSLGYPMDEYQIGQAMSSLDTSGDGWISLQEFTVWWTSS